MSGEFWCLRLGQVPYGEARAAQKRLEAARLRGELPDLLLLLEHPPVYTKGRRAEPGELGMGEDWYRMQGIEVTETDRGGRVTYHGPGQLVGYPIVSLRELGSAADGREMGVVEYVRRMERVMIDSLADFTIGAEVIDGLTGVWVGGRPPEGRKIGSIGIHVNRGVTTHGFAVNVNNDLQPFEWIVPCGIEGVRMTSLCRELGAQRQTGRADARPRIMSAYMDAVTSRFAGIYDLEPASIEAEELAARTEGLEALLAAGPPAAHLHGNGAPASVR